MGRISITFKGTSYDVTITGDDIKEIKREYEKIRQSLDKLTVVQRRSAEKRPRIERGEFRGLLNQRIMELVDDDFFKIEKTIAEVVAELRNKGYPYSQPAVGMALLTFVRKKLLRRILETKDGKKQYFYTNP
ncbi:MAG: hypothetical protein WB643_01915 [Candidatus Bathyarchaeia archaeon]